MKIPSLAALTALSLFMLSSDRAQSADLPRFDFTKSDQVQVWAPTHDIAALTPAADGMQIQINGDDPYTIGPARDYPAGQGLWLHIRLKSERGGMGQVFYFQQGPTEENSVHFPVRPGIWEEARVALPPLGPGYRLRLDPPGTGGSCTVGFITLEPRNIPVEPSWPVPPAPVMDRNSFSVRSGDVRLIHSRGQAAGFVVEVAGQSMAVGFTRPQIGYTQGNETHWLDLVRSTEAKVERDGDAIVSVVTARDADGATWTFLQRFSPAKRPGAINVDTEVTVDQPRTATFIPILVLLPGVGSFGAIKTQGLFAGVEYLDNEPSSSQADLTVPAYRRQTPDTEKITFPLMAVAANGRYVGLTWHMDSNFSALYDSPDRTFKGGGHLMGILFPGSNGHNRVEGSLLPYEGVTLKTDEPLILHAAILGGRGDSVVPVVQDYVARHPLPLVPSPGLDFEQYAATAAAGYLDSAIREGDRYRHAIPGSFTPGAVADVPTFMTWLAQETTDPNLSARLKDAAKGAIGQVDPGAYNVSGIAHVNFPMESLVYGHVEDNVQRALASGRDLLHRFEPDGSVLYHADPRRQDFGKTHFAPDANGLTAQVVRSLLDDAALTGDPALLREGLRTLRALDKFDNTVPRGAQTWEVPLHTPDILASAHLVRAYTLGYELSGDRHFLDRAIYWAWTGVPLVYLRNPAAGPVGPYATIAVLGATGWVAPVWIGLPVQWCGLVYADALYRLQRHDPTGPWKQIADGITASGIQQTWPRGSGDHQGLLPDSFNLINQSRNDPGINPGTVMANAVRLYNRPALYDFRSFRATGLLVHAPGSLTNTREEGHKVSFTVNGWPREPYYLLIAGLKAAPQVRINGKPASLTAPNQYVEGQGRLVLQLQGKEEVEVTTTDRGR